MPTGQEKFYETGAAFFGAGAVFIVGLALLAATTGLLLLTAVMAPGVTTRCSGAIRRRGLLSLAAGAGVCTVLVLAGMLVGKIEILRLPWLVAAVIPTVLGLAAVSEEVGRRLYALAGREGTRTSHLVAGWLVSATAACIPVLGWFVVTTYLLWSGTGSCVVAFFPAAEGPSPKPADLKA